MLTGYYSGVGGFVPGPLSPTTEAGNPQDHVFAALGPYAQDDWKVTQKLSINYGLRWDFRAAAYEASNHFFWLDTTNAQGGLCYADPKLTTNGVAPGRWHQWGPNPPLLREGTPTPARRRPLPLASA